MRQVFRQLELEPAEPCLVEFWVQLALAKAPFEFRFQRGYMFDGYDSEPVAALRQGFQQFLTSGIDGSSHQVSPPWLNG